MELKKKRLQNFSGALFSLVLVYILTYGVAFGAKKIWNAGQIRQYMVAIRGANFIAAIIGVFLAMTICYTVIYKKEISFGKTIENAVTAVLVCDTIGFVLSIVLVKIVGQNDAQTLTFAIKISQFIIRFLCFYFGCAMLNITDAEREEMQKQQEAIMAEYERNKAKKRKK